MFKMDDYNLKLTQHDPGFLRSQWDSLTAQYASSPSINENVFNNENVFKSIVDEYSAANRAYHNLSHIQSLFSLSETVMGKVQNPDAFRFAIWFHDVIYNTKRSDNEEKSAEFAEEALTALGVPAQTIAITLEMILATKHHLGADLSWDHKAFLDIDTAILGAPEEIYKEYSMAIRKEYSWVPGFLYRRNRRKFLREFLERDRIYLTEEIGTMFELHARHNLAEEISSLSD